MKEGKVYSEFLMDWVSPLTKGERRKVRKAARQMMAAHPDAGQMFEWPAHVDARCFSPVTPSGVGFTYTVKAFFPAEDSPEDGYQSQTYKGLRYTKEKEYISVDELYLRAPGAPVFAKAKAGECYREDL